MQSKAGGAPASPPLRRLRPEEVALQELLEAFRMDLNEAGEIIRRNERALTELTERLGFGIDLRPETREWARGGIAELIGLPALKALVLEAATG